MTCGKAPGNAQCLYRGVMEYTQKKKKRKKFAIGNEFNRGMCD